MGKRYLIDSNVVIGYLDSKLSAKGMEIMNDIIDAEPNVSVITKIEVLRFNTSVEIYRILEDFMDVCTVFELNSTVVGQTIAICKSNKIKLPDAIIAATALANNLTLITRNISDLKTFKIWSCLIRGLKILIAPHKAISQILLFLSKKIKQ